MDFKHSDINIAANHLLQLMQDVIRLQTKTISVLALHSAVAWTQLLSQPIVLKQEKKLLPTPIFFPICHKPMKKLWIDSMRNMGFDMNTFVGESYWPLKPEWNISLNSPVSNPYRHLKTVIYQRAPKSECSVVANWCFADHLYSGSFIG